eukprot:9792326-Alexandrium_andersonii.AAC.1
MNGQPMHYNGHHSLPDHGWGPPRANGDGRPPDPSPSRPKAALSRGEGCHRGRVRPLLGKDLNRHGITTPVP